VPGRPAGPAAPAPRRPGSSTDSTSRASMATSDLRGRGGPAARGPVGRAGRAPCGGGLLVRRALGSPAHPSPRRVTAAGAADPGRSEEHGEIQDGDRAAPSSWSSARERLPELLALDHLDGFVRSGVGSTMPRTCRQSRPTCIPRLLTTMIARRDGSPLPPRARPRPPRSRPPSPGGNAEVQEDPEVEERERVPAPATRPGMWGGASGIGESPSRAGPGSPCPPSRALTAGAADVVGARGPRKKMIDRDFKPAFASSTSRRTLRSSLRAPAPAAFRFPGPPSSTSSSRSRGGGRARRTQPPDALREALRSVRPKSGA